MRSRRQQTSGPHRICFFFIVSAFLFSCQPPNHRPQRQISPAFYYWKSTYAPGTYELNRISELQVNTQYIKFFDVDWNPVRKQAQPLAAIRFANGYQDALKNCQLVPVVFITNECMRHLDTISARLLANRILQLVLDIRNGYDLKRVTELQIDCDWTAGTREPYFALLDELKKLDTNLIISATIRLHQVKQVKHAGIPPVHRGLLMCYNMGDLRDPSGRNSILDPEELKKYLGKLHLYPLPLDIALPLFDWTVLFRNGKYAGLLKLNPGDLPVSALKKISTNRYLLLKDTALSGFPCRKNDELRYEASNLEDILLAGDYLSQTWKDTSARISFFHMDSLILQKYSSHDLKIVLDRFR